MAELNHREELISFLRGFIAVPLFAELEKLGVIESMVGGPFSIDDFDVIPNKPHRTAVLSYLVATGIVETLSGSRDHFQLTPLGTSVLKRSGTAQIMYSYREMLASIGPVLTSTVGLAPECDRAMNVQGSGKTHGRKFFEPTIELMERWNLSFLADLSAGDGDFLVRSTRKLSLDAAFVNDLSPVAVDIAMSAVGQEVGSRVGLFSHVGDARNVAAWRASLPQSMEVRHPQMAVAMWFLLHEIAQEGVSAITSFLSEIRGALPHAKLVVGEVFRLEPELISPARWSSVLPEFYFFHHFSGQAVLSKAELELGFSDAGYAVDFFRGVDSVAEDYFSAGTYGLSPIV